MTLLRARTGLAVIATVAAALLATAVPASARTAAPTTRLGGTTSVTTAPGLAGTLLGAGILPLPVPRTKVRLGYAPGGLTVTYGFPITGGNPDLAGPSGDILHTGGIDFVSRRGHLEIGRFDVDLAAGKVFATEVNFASARIPVLDLNLSKLHVTTKGKTTVLTGVSVNLDPAAATALNSTFGIALPTDGSLVFGGAAITLRS